MAQRVETLDAKADNLSSVVQEKKLEYCSVNLSVYSLFSNSVGFKP